MSSEQNLSFSGLLRPECPTVDSLARHFDGLSELGARREFSRHIQQCCYCESEWRALTEFTAARPTTAERAAVESIVACLKQSRKPQRASLWSFWSFAKAASLAALLLLAVAGGLRWRTGLPAVSNEFGVSGQLRSSSKVEILTRGDVKTAPAKLAWKATPGAASYEVVLSEVDGTQLWSARSAVTEVPLPAAVRKLMLPRKTLHWRVSAQDNQGLRIAESGTAVIRVVPAR